MAGGRKLDDAGRACARTVISRSPLAAFGLLAVLLLPSLPGPAVAQEPASDSARLAAAQKQFDAGHWEPAARLAQGPANQSVDLDFVAGLALAKLQRWEDARAAFAIGHRKA